MNKNSGSSGRSGSSGSCSYSGVHGLGLVTPCCDSDARSGKVIDDDLSFYCNKCDKRVLRKDFVSEEKSINNRRFKILEEILNETN